MRGALLSLSLSLSVVVQQLAFFAPAAGSASFLSSVAAEERKGDKGERSEGKARQSYVVSKSALHYLLRGKDRKGGRED